MKWITKIHFGTIFYFNPAGIFFSYINTYSFLLRKSDVFLDQYSLVKMHCSFLEEPNHPLFKHVCLGYSNVIKASVAV